MVSDKIRTNSAALNVLMGQVSQEQEDLLRIVCANLVAAADEAEELERNLVVPMPVGPATTEAATTIEEGEFREAM
jgi:hypothetical protein